MTTDRTTSAALAALKAGTKRLSARRPFVVTTSLVDVPNGLSTITVTWPKPVGTYVAVAFVQADGAHLGKLVASAVPSTRMPTSVDVTMLATGVVDDIDIVVMIVPS